MAMLRPVSEMKDSGIKYIGFIPYEWNIRKIGHITKKLTDYVASGSFASLAENVQYLDYPDYAQLVRTVDLSESTNRKPVYVSREAYEYLSNSNLFGGEIILPNIGSVGSVYQYEPIYEHATLAPNAIMMDFEECNRYYYYWFSNPIVSEALCLIGNGTVQIKFNKTQLRQFYAPQPSLAEQQTIANYLDDRCSKLDEIITEAEKSIEEYKELKQAVIFEAVTKGLDKKVPMKDSGVEWLPQVPASWNVRRIASVYEESKETGRDDLPILLVSIHTGISDREVDNDERDRKVIRSEDKTVYKVVHKNYLAYNMMRAWQGGFGAATVDGLVSPAYVVAKPKIEVNSSYVEHVLRTPNAIEYIRGLSYGVADFRLRLYWPYFKNIKVPLPPIEEQNKIVSYIQDQSNKMDALISEKQSLIEDLKAYKKSLIYEVVTGKRRVV